MKRNAETEAKLQEMQDKVLAGELDIEELNKAAAEYFKNLQELNGWNTDET